MMAVVVERGGAMSAEAIRKFADMSRRVGLLLVRFRRTGHWRHPRAQQEELLRELNAELRRLKLLMRSLPDDGLREAQLASYRKMLADAAEAADRQVKKHTTEGAP